MNNNKIVLKNVLLNNDCLFVIIGNPPYNAWQATQNENNANKTQKTIDKKIKDTYAQDSLATLKNSLYDPYVKAIKWATDRIEKNGIVAYITNNRFIDGISFDGMRKHLHKDFNTIYIVDLGGNSRKKSPKKVHNIFGIRVGVCISFLVRTPENTAPHKIYYHKLDETKSPTETFETLESLTNPDKIPWQEIIPNSKNDWFPSPRAAEYAAHISIGNKKAKKAKHEKDAQFTQNPAIFKSYSAGVKTNRDSYLYNFSSEKLTEYVKKMIENYIKECAKYHAIPESQRSPNIQNDLTNDTKKIAWARGLLQHLSRQRPVKPFESSRIIVSQYRPFTLKYLYFDEMLMERQLLNHLYFPLELYSGTRKYPFADPPWHEHLNMTAISGADGGAMGRGAAINSTAISRTDDGRTANRGADSAVDGRTADRGADSAADSAVEGRNAHYVFPNIVIAVSGLGHSSGYFSALASKYIFDSGALECGAQCFPYYVYSADGTERAENITDWALGHVQKRCGAGITKWQIFSYIYALLNHEEYRTRYAEDLAKELPRIPVTEDSEVFHKLSELGAELINTHSNFMSYPSQNLQIEAHKGYQPDMPLEAVEKIILSKEKQTLKCRPYFTIKIPKEAFEYTIEGQPACHVFTRFYKKSKDPRSGHVDCPLVTLSEYISLLSQVVVMCIKSAQLIKKINKYRI